MRGKILVPLFAALCVTPAFAQIPIGPASGPTAETVTVQHPGGPVGPNWVGIAVKVHLLDNTELDISSITNTFSANPANVGGAFTSFPFGPASSGNISSSRVFPVWITTFLGGTPNTSGIAADFGNPLNAMRFNIDIKGTSPINNGDTDFTVMVGNIYHVPSFVSSISPAPGMWWASSTGAPFAPVPSGMAIGPSQFYATFFSTLAFGVEHSDQMVPEPASAAVVGGGLACLLIGLGIRRRRRSHVA